MSRLFFAYRKDFSDCSIRTQAASYAVSLLKLEPKVSSFPVLESVITDSSAHATGKILSIFLYVYDIRNKWTSWNSS